MAQSERAGPRAIEALPVFQQATANAAAFAHGRVVPRRLEDLLDLPDADLEKVDIVELNLAIARQISELRSLDVARYQRTADEWAAWVKHELARNVHRFHNRPGDYDHSLARWQAGMMATVVGLDFKVRYDHESSFERPEDGFLHGILDQRLGTCATMPLMLITLGQRLGFPIRGVAVPGHLFCRWDDPATGERFNIEATNGVAHHDDEYYRHWPVELDPRWEREHHMLKSLTMRELAAVMIGQIAGYYTAKDDRPAAVRWDAMAHWLDPLSRSTFICLKLNVDHGTSRFFDAEELAGRKKYYELKSHPSRLVDRDYLIQHPELLDIPGRDRRNSLVARPLPNE